MKTGIFLLAFLLLIIPLASAQGLNVGVNIDRTDVQTLTNGVVIPAPVEPAIPSNLTNVNSSLYWGNMYYTNNIYVYNHTQSVYDLWNDVWLFNRYSDGDYLYNSSDTYYFNSTKLNNTILTSINNIYNNITNYVGQNYVPYNNATANVNLGNYNLTADWLFGKLNYSDIQNVPPAYNDSDLLPAQPYLYNDTTYFYLNETHLNSTIRNLAEVKAYEENFTINTSGGAGGNISLTLFDFEITQVIVTPFSNTTNYRFQLTDIDGNIIDANRMVHHGIWDIYKNFAIYNKSVVANLSSVSVDGTFNVKIKYIDNFRP